MCMNMPCSRVFPWSWVNGARAKTIPAFARGVSSGGGTSPVFGLPRGDGLYDRLEIVDRRLFPGGQLALGSEVFEQHRQRVLDAADLLSVAGDIAEDFFLGGRVR